MDIDSALTDFFALMSIFLIGLTLTLTQALLHCGETIFISHLTINKQEKNMTVKPLQDRVLVKRLEEENKTASGIIIPDNSKEKPSEGEVIAVGTGYRLQDGSIAALDVKVGDKILFEKWGGTEVKVDGEEFLVMKEDKILGILQ